MIKFPTTLTTRQWMKAAKAWRCYFELPSDSILASQLTALIEEKVDVTLQSSEGILVEIKPAFIVDVPNKGKRFSLVIETMTPQQVEKGPYITGMIGDSAVISIAPQATGPVFPTETTPDGDIDPKILRGLHTAWFKNERFWAFLTRKTGREFYGEKMCKQIFKEHMQVESCKHLKQAAFNELLAEFNEYVNQR